MAGVTVIEDRVPEATVRVVFPEIVPEVAVMIAEPTVTAVVRPPVLTVATAVFDEVQVTEMVISWVVPSENVPVAVNCWVAPTDRLGLDGVTAMDDRVAEFTVTVVLPEIVPEVAVMVVTPVVRAVARPLLLTVAIVVSEELQVTCVVISWVVPSAYVPVAVNCWVAPPGMFGLAGVTAREDSVEEVTVRVVFPETVPTLAVMVAVPAARAVAKPLLLTVATVVSEELQEAWVVISPLGPTANVPVAVNCWVAPTDMVAVAGLTAMEVGSAIPFSPPQVFKDGARDARINIAKTSLIFFMMVQFFPER